MYFLQSIIYCNWLCNPDRFNILQKELESLYNSKFSDLHSDFKEIQKNDQVNEKKRQEEGILNYDKN